MSKNQEVEIQQIRGNEIDVMNLETQEEGTLQIVEPALKWISRVKQGKATIGLDAEGNCNYVKMANFTPQSNFKPQPQRNFNSYSKPSYGKKPYSYGSQTNSFKTANKFEQAPYHIEISRKILEKVTLVEADIILTDLEKQGIWVFATNFITRLGEFIEDPKTKVPHIYYDCILWVKKRVEGARKNPEDDVDFDELGGDY